MFQRRLREESRLGEN